MIAIHPFFARSLKAHRYAWLAGIVLALTFGAWSAHAFRSATELRVTTAPVEMGPVVRRVVASGTLQAVSIVEVGAQVSGTIQSLAADYNSIVKSSQTIAKLDPSLFEAAAREAQGALLQKRAALAQTQADEAGAETAERDSATKQRRAEELAAKQLIPQSDLDAARDDTAEFNAALWSARSQVAEATAAVDAAKATLEQATVNLEHTIIASPIDGIVIGRNVDVGQTVAASVQTPVLFTIATDLKHLRLEASLDEADVGGIDAGERVTFDVESYPDEIFSGTVSQVRVQPVAAQPAASSAALSPTPAGATDAPVGTTYLAIVDVSNPDEKLRPGMTAVVKLDGLHRDRVLRVPNGALSFRPSPDALATAGQTTAILSGTANSADTTSQRLWQDDGHRFFAVPVVTGLSDSQWTELVGSSLGAGNPVVTDARVVKKH